MDKDTELELKIETARRVYNEFINNVDKFNYIKAALIHNLKDYEQFDLTYNHIRVFLAAYLLELVTGGIARPTDIKEITVDIGTNQISPIINHKSELKGKLFDGTKARSLLEILKDYNKHTEIKYTKIFKNLDEDVKSFESAKVATGYYKPMVILNKKIEELYEDLIEKKDPPIEIIIFDNNQMILKYLIDFIYNKVHKSRDRPTHFYGRLTFIINERTQNENFNDKIEDINHAIEKNISLQDNHIVMCHKIRDSDLYQACLKKFDSVVIYTIKSSQVLSYLPLTCILIADRKHEKYEVDVSMRLIEKESNQKFVSNEIIMDSVVIREGEVVFNDFKNFFKILTRDESSVKIIEWNGKDLVFLQN